MVLSDWLQERLEIDELSAILGHEEGHIQLHLAKWAKAVAEGTLQAGPMIDPAAELEADAFSAALGNSPKALVSAFGKIKKMLTKSLTTLSFALVSLGIDDEEDFIDAIDNLFDDAAAERISALSAM